MNSKHVRYLTLTSAVVVVIFFVWQLVALNGRLTFFSILLFLGSLVSYIWSKTLLKDKD
ncbi:MAG: hypothetical protein JJU16_00875 [Alkalibacterium sp.]|nr:hypothetical protein [Alkalibacterium sp.]